MILATDGTDKEVCSMNNKKTDKNTTDSQEKDEEIIKVPDFDGRIDFEALDKLLGIDLSEITPDKTQQRSNISKAIGYIIDQIFNQLHLGKKMKKKIYKDGGTTWTFKKFECYLAIYLQNGSLSYTVRLNTLNCHETNSVLYFSYENMCFYNASLLYGILRDFTRLIGECANMEFAPEHYDDMLPRETHKNHSPFYCVHENMVMHPMHYYDGYIDYEHDRKLILNDFDSWLDKLKERHGQ